MDRCHLDYDDAELQRVYGDPAMRNEVIEHLQAIFVNTPLEIVAGVLLRYPHLDSSVRKILGSYDEFVSMLANDRQHRVWTISRRAQRTTTRHSRRRAN